MQAVIIACKTIEQELLAAMRAVNCQHEIRWLESGLHNWPQKLNTQLQALLDGCREFDTVLLCMSLCGNSVIGLRTHGFQLVIPRCDDCITLLLGSSDRRKEISATYFLTEGWLKSQWSLPAEYEKCQKKYGPTRAKRIFSTMLANYRHLPLLDTGCFDTRTAAPEIRSIARQLELDYIHIDGTLDYIRELLTGNWPHSRFIHIPPHSTLTHRDCVTKGAESHV